METGLRGRRFAKREESLHTTGSRTYAPPTSGALAKSIIVHLTHLRVPVPNKLADLKYWSRSGFSLNHVRTRTSTNNRKCLIIVLATIPVLNSNANNDPNNEINQPGPAIGHLVYDNYLPLGVVSSSKLNKEYKE